MPMTLSAYKGRKLMRNKQIYFYKNIAPSLHLRRFPVFALPKPRYPILYDSPSQSPRHPKKKSVAGAVLTIIFRNSNFFVSL